MNRALRSLPALLLLPMVGACPSKGPVTMMTPPGYTPKAFTAAEYQGVLTGAVAASGASGASGSVVVGGAVSATAVGAACTHDWDCWIGQQCKSNACAASSVDDKLYAEITVPAAGNYVVAAYVPVDATDGGTADEIQLAFEFAAAAREPRIFQPIQRNLPIDLADYDHLRARTLIEPTLRAGEHAALRWLDAHPWAREVGPARDAAASAACTAGQFGFKGGCYSEGQALPSPIHFKLGQMGLTIPDITVVVAKVTGNTAILLDQAATMSDADLTKLATAFDTVAAPRDQQFYNGAMGHTGAIDTDGNGMMGVVLSPKVGDVGLAGLFDFRDVIPTANAQDSEGDLLAACTDNPTMQGCNPDASGNQMDIMWAVPIGQTYTPKGTSTMHTATFELVIGTLAHEYQHVINFAHASAQSPVKQEALFLNEALSHLAEDITGYGQSNVTAVSTFLNDPEFTGLQFGSDGADKDSVQMRGLGYLYLRWNYERVGGASTGADGKLTDGGGIAMLNQLLAVKTSGVASTAAVIGSAFNVYPLFFPALAISNNAANAPLMATDKRFNFATPTTDPLTKQKVGINLNDPTRTDPYGMAVTSLAGYAPKNCDSQSAAEGGKCTIFASGGVAFIWEGATANQIVRLKGPSAQNGRLALVQVK